VLSAQGRSAYRDLGYLTELEAAQELAPQATVGGEYSLPQRFFELLGE